MSAQSPNRDGESPIERILELARWAPSGDNTQPWRFQLTDARSFAIHATDTRDWCVYDLQGRASQLAVGALLETIALAASGEGFAAQFTRRGDSPESAPVVDVELRARADLAADPLREQIPKRATQRRPLSRRPLTAGAKRQLEDGLPPGYAVVWIEGPSEKRRMARLLFRNAGIRLSIPEAYRVHREVIEWGAQYSQDRIPDAAVGLDPLTLHLMRWAMKSWERVAFLNRYLGGTLMPRLQLDYLPALRCAAHFALVAERAPTTVDDYFAAGRAVQRLWLGAASAGLQFQPEMTPVIFAGYVREGIRFTQVESALREAASLRRELEDIVGEAASRTVFAGRLGYGRAPTARSLRLPLSRLLIRRASPSSVSETS